MLRWGSEKIIQIRKVISVFLGILVFVLGASIVITILVFSYAYIVVPLLNKRDERLGKRPAVEVFMNENEISPSTITRFFDGKYLIFDQNTDLLWMYNPKKDFAIKAYRDGILGCELKINDDTEYRTSMSSAAGRAIVGGVLFGGVGAIIGGVTAKKKSNYLIHKITLTIYFDIEGLPYEEMEIFSDVRGSRETDSYYKDKYQSAMYWSKFIERYIS